MLYEIMCSTPPSRRSGTASDCKRDGREFDFHSEECIIFILELAEWGIEP